MAQQSEVTPSGPASLCKTQSSPVKMTQAPQIKILFKKGSNVAILAPTKGPRGSACLWASKAAVTFDPKSQKR